MLSKDDVGPFSTERARATLAICIVFLILATLAVAARFWARRIKGVKLALDDWLVVASLIFYYLSAIETILQLVIGRLGHHANGSLSPDQLRNNGKLGAFGQYAYAFTMGCVRWSICALLYRIFITKMFRRLILACGVINVLWIIFNIIKISVLCIPFSKYWSKTESGTCLPEVPVVAALTGWGLAIELAIWSLPIPASWSLQMPLSGKLALASIFGLGILDIGAGVGRLITVLQVDEKDPTWSEVPALQWLAIEPSIAIIVACLIVCRPLMEKLRPRNWWQKSKRGQSGDDHIMLVPGKPGYIHRSTGNHCGITADSATAGQAEHGGSQGSVVHVRKDFGISVDNRV